MKRLVPLPFYAYGMGWVAVLLISGVQFRLIVLAYGCQGCGAYHRFEGF